MCTPGTPKPQEVKNKVFTGGMTPSKYIVCKKKVLNITLQKRLYNLKNRTLKLENFIVISPIHSHFTNKFGRGSMPTKPQPRGFDTVCTPPRKRCVHAGKANGFLTTEHVREDKTHKWSQMTLVIQLVIGPHNAKRYACFLFPHTQSLSNKVSLALINFMKFFLIMKGKRGFDDRTCARTQNTQMIPNDTCNTSGNWSP